MKRKHPHEGRMAEVYAAPTMSGMYVFLYYTAEPPEGATWNDELQAWVLTDG